MPVNHLSGHLTLETCTQVLAYSHYYTIPYLSCRGLPARHLQRLALWLGLPDDKLQTIRHHRFLAAHLVLLQATGLLQHETNQWFCSLFVEQWLQKTPFAQYQTLIEAIDRCSWETVAERENLSACFDDAYSTFVRQSLENQQRTQSSQEGGHAIWKSITDEEWQLALPAGLPPKTLFHLLQLGEWDPQEPLRISALTVAKTRQKGYGINYIEHLLTEATQQNLPQPQQAQLVNWYMAAEHYQIQAAYLLSTAQPEQLAKIMANGRLNRKIHEQISSRHAIVSPALITPLARWLAKQNKYLQAPNLEADIMKPDWDASAFTWLGLKLLIDLRELLTLPFPAPFGLLDEMAATLTPEEQTELRCMAHDVIQELRQALRGKDAFLPAQKTVSQEMLDQISQAIEQGAPLMITYQALGEIKPSMRHIQPLRLESRANLYYLYAYCYRAETNLTFRLDRVSQLAICS